MDIIVDAGQQRNLSHLFCIGGIQARPKLTVWFAFSADRKLGPFILHDTIENNRYLNILQIFVWPQVSVCEV